MKCEYFTLSRNVQEKLIVLWPDLLYRGLSVKTEAIQSASRGLVGDITFGVLPEIKAIHCFGITLAVNAVGGPASAP